MQVLRCCRLHVQVVRLPMYNISAEVEAGAREAHLMAAYKHQHVLSLHCAFMHKDELLPYMEVSAQPSAASSCSSNKCQEQ